MPPFFPNNPTATYAARFVILALVYGLVAYFSLEFIPQSASGASLVWPAAAIALAGLAFWGLNLWPAVVLAFFVVFLARGAIPAFAAAASAAYAIEALAGAYILLRVGFHPMMSRLRDSLGLILAAFIASLVAATLISGSFVLLLGHAFSSSLWLGILIGHTVSLLCFAPFVLRWWYRPLFTKSSRETVEGVALFGGVAVLTFLIFWTPYGSAGNISFIYLLLFSLIWASLRTGPRGTSLALLIISLVAVSGILWGFGPSTARAAEALFAMQLLLGTFSLIFILFTSITEERKEAVVALEGHVGQLESALEKISSEDRAKAEFIAILAHELRNPLSPVLSGLEILKAKGSGPQDIHQMMGAHLNTLARLLDDLLDITRISQKKFRIERETTTLQSIIERSLEMALPYLNSRGHKFSKELPEQEVWIDADPVRLEQVFVNLLNNAGKYTPQGGTISLVARREGSYAVVRVRDNGQGIAQGRMQKIFEQFASRGTTDVPAGLHIGLSLAKRMVELHQGHIEVVSGGVGKGSEFVVRLPLPEVVQKPLMSAVKKGSRGRFSKETVAEHIKEADAVSVLVVDDNEAAAKMLCTLLEHNGHKAAVAYTGHEALDRAREISARAVLLDIGLPDIDGYEVARRLREEFGDEVALIALTGYGQSEDKAKAMWAGFDDHLVKPVSIVDVERALSNLRKSA